MIKPFSGASYLERLERVTLEIWRAIHRMNDSVGGIAQIGSSQELLTICLSGTDLQQLAATTEQFRQEVLELIEKEGISLSFLVSKLNNGREKEVMKVYATRLSGCDVDIPWALPFLVANFATSPQT
ncbi:MAG: hypothetical protein A2939_02385 [Parcubacteria group bacterium RIFCSPLOWO2_01_FULL_48_18]|nr:MAG: hypothetical protein A3J67_02400 [Parcubacteria group bacterium RIFCSPHIGHO2_02_FULL_48_10b]OHB23236.1 MAG: hypothetical protein A2939_02385 [Parcubacteria group bacterium RIFCSPLOWO2_01_FULL_48_18]